MFTFNSLPRIFYGRSCRTARRLNFRRNLTPSSPWSRPQELALCHESGPRAPSGQKKSYEYSKAFKAAAGVFSALILTQFLNGELSPEPWTHGDKQLTIEFSGNRIGSSDINTLFVSSAASNESLVASLWRSEAIAQDMETFLEDDTGLLSGNVVSRVNSSLQKLSKQTGYKVFLLMTRDLPIGTDLSALAREIHESRNGDSNLVVFVLNPKTAKAGFFAGSEIEHIIPASVLTSTANETYPYNTLKGKYGSAVLDVSERLEAVLSGKKDPGAPIVYKSEQSSSFKTREETESQRKKYIGAVVALLIISIVAPMAQYFWYQRK
ncbi:hypothetical protein CCYA_CCYA10G2924 [Cyanidiococcus yangmingshanensis]|nr:hypothetical protein CCYA_CCYA10G2924 [Cyanidiococcus yangmingshanensis]